MSQIILLFPHLYLHCFIAMHLWDGTELPYAPIMLYMVLDLICAIITPKSGKWLDKEISANSISTRLEQAYRYHTLLGLFGNLRYYFWHLWYSPDLWGSIHESMYASITLPCVVLNISK